MIGKIAQSLKRILPEFLYNISKTVYECVKSIFKPFYNIYFNFKLKKIQANHKKALEIVRKKEKIKVAFFLIHESVWKYEGVYRLMEQDDRFEPFVIVCPYITYGEEQMLKDMERAFHSFSKKGYNTIKTLKENGTWLDVKNEIKPDIVFFTNPHKLTKDKYYIFNFLDTLTCYVQYSFHVSHLNNAQYNKPFHNLIWKLFSETPIHIKMSMSIARNKGVNNVLTGYPGTDIFIKSNYAPQNVWGKKKELKKIIWSPHHTILENDSNLGYSNFLEYSDFFLMLIEKYKDKIFFCFKPHPILKSKLYNHAAWGKKKTDAYYDIWKNKENTIIQDGEYTDLFLTSDGMINDSGSYLAEYLFVNKPSLFMVRNNDVLKRFNVFGKKCLNVVYKSYSKQNVIGFIEHVILNENDYLKEKRENFVNKNMIPPNNQSASENIINFLKQELK